jgi:hypothetical protein
MAARMAMMAMTTSSSIKVKALADCRRSNLLVATDAIIFILSKFQSYEGQPGFQPVAHH